MKRKDDHIEHAYLQKEQMNDFDRIRFVHTALPNIAFEEVDMSTRIGKMYLPIPIFINAMTGGSMQAKEINEKLAKIAEACNIPMASGSLSSAIKDETLSDTFEVIRKNNMDGLIFANIGADKTLKDAKQAIQIVKADALQIHLNIAQEMIMPEGDRDFTNWEMNIRDIVDNIEIDVIAKEVGFGMGMESIRRLKGLGVKIVDISGKGGTNFALVENARRKHTYPYLNNWGLSTVESLLEAKAIDDMEVLASGGIRNPLDAIKALALGARAVGMASWFLKLVKEETVEEGIQKTKSFIEEMRTVMTILNARNLRELRSKAMIFDDVLHGYIIQRNIKI